MMERTKNKSNGTITNEAKLILQHRINDVLSRAGLARRLGYSYSDERKLYEALGYPVETDLTYEYFFNKYDRMEFANTIITRPVMATWNGNLTITEDGEMPADSKLAEAWKELDERLKVKSRLVKLDKIAGIGRFGILLFGFNDVKKIEDWLSPVVGKKKLLYLKQFSEAQVNIETWETNSSKERYGLPLIYKITLNSVTERTSKDIMVHHSRLLHVMDGNLLSEVYGTPRLKPIINRLNDIEKVLGGDAEMFWRGARPGYHAKAQEGYEMSDPEIEALEDELDKYEHDLRRFISAKGVDMEALEMQVADPAAHVDVQLQAISAQTGIPKRILVGSERGELASTQDKDTWLTLIQARMLEFAEPVIFRPFIDKCMEHGVLPEVKDYVVGWADIFAPSEKQKAEVGEIRAKGLKSYADSVFASEILPPQLAYKFLLGLTDEQAQEVLDVTAEQIKIGDGTGIREPGEPIEPPIRRTRTRQPNE